MPIHRGPEVQMSPGNPGLRVHMPIHRGPQTQGRPYPSTGDHGLTWRPYPSTRGPRVHMAVLPVPGGRPPLAPVEPPQALLAPGPTHAIPLCPRGDHTAVPDCRRSDSRRLEAECQQFQTRRGKAPGIRQSDCT